MELKELAGEHLFDAVDFSDEQVKTWGDEFEACQVMRFRLDGNVYVAVEDPSDGYRSCMNELTVCEDATMKNVFEPVKVIGRHRDKGTYNSIDDVLELIDAGTGKVVLEVGTENTDDYYPCFVAAFHPEAMTPNAGGNSAGTALSCQSGVAQRSES
ncbi:hypothetical protein [Propionivibrio sp.]|uniref:hypothetical protein n=1 Tax=Propionivibrio sp. TaxID=2212460 RepID=UPI0025EB6E32|nr:hypothetical protein [Propionivibrio sp.]MBK7357536.1 hypothetical protein [Propionivibrio sp.]